LSPSLDDAVASLLRSIPERWADFDHDALSRTEQQDLFLLVAAGLVERRIGVRGEFAGQAPAIEFTIDATGEYGVVEALDPVVAEMWTKWGPAFEAWRASDAKDSTPFRFTRTGLDRWRLTEQGVLARGDLDIQAPSEGAAAFVGSYQRTIEFVTRTGHQANRPNVRGEGRLVEMRTPEVDGEAKPTPAPVSLANSEELAAAFRDALLPEIVEALQSQRHADDANAKAKTHDEPDADGELPPSLSENQITIMRTMAECDPARLLSASRIEEAISPERRISERTIGDVLRRLIELGYAERPEGERRGARLTIRGRRILRKIAD